MDLHAVPGVTVVAGLGLGLGWVSAKAIETNKGRRMRNIETPIEKELQSLEVIVINIGLIEHKSTRVN